MSPNNEPTVQVPVSLIESCIEYAEAAGELADAVELRTLLSRQTPTAEASGTDVLATDEEMTEYGEAERLRVPTAEDAANALRAEGWDRAYDDMAHVKFPNRNPFRDIDPSTIRDVTPPQ